MDDQPLQKPNFTAFYVIAAIIIALVIWWANSPGDTNTDGTCYDVQEAVPYCEDTVTPN